MYFIDLLAAIVVKFSLPKLPKFELNSPSKDRIHFSSSKEMEQNMNLKWTKNSILLLFYF